MCARECRVEDGASLGSYRLDSRLGIGGMAEVWLARCLQRGGEFALKVLPLDGQRPELVAMFLDEAMIGRHLRHPSLVGVLDHFTDRGYSCHVMEYVDGRDLRRVLSSAHRAVDAVPWPLALYVVHELALGLSYAHRLENAAGEAMGIIHRDVAPHNIMLTRQGQVRLLDFGIARARVRLAETEPGLVKGRTGYVEPERLVGATATPSSDVWSLGMVLYALLQSGPHARSLPQSFSAEGVELARPGLPDTLLELVAAMTRPRARRVADMELVARRARAILRGSSISAARAPIALASWLASIGAFSARPRTRRVAAPGLESRVSLGFEDVTRSGADPLGMGAG